MGQLNISAEFDVMSLRIEEIAPVLRGAADRSESLRRLTRMGRIGGLLPQTLHQTTPVKKGQEPPTLCTATEIPTGIRYFCDPIKGQVMLDEIWVLGTSCHTFWRGHLTAAMPPR